MSKLFMLVEGRLCAFDRDTGEFYSVALNAMQPTPLMVKVLADMLSADDKEKDK